MHGKQSEKHIPIGKRALGPSMMTPEKEKEKKKGETEQPEGMTPNVRIPARVVREKR